MRIAILTNFHDFNPGYSLTGIVADQVRMLHRYGHDVHLFMSESHCDKFDHLRPDGAEIHFTVPHEILSDPSSKEDRTFLQEKHRRRVGPWLVETLRDFDIAYTHDWILTGWNLPFALAMQDTCQQTRHIGFMHWIHSIPCGFKDWWHLAHYGANGKPRNHFIISPTAIMAQALADQYRCTKEHVRRVHHIKDPRVWLDFSDETCDFIDDHPGVLQADVVCVYPAACDRLSPKQVHLAMMIMAGMKRRCLTTAFICANQWASRQVYKEKLDSYYELANEMHLVHKHNKPTDEYAEEFIFTSEWRFPKYEGGISGRFLRELLQLSNLFMFPTMGESFGLVGPEAALCGNYMVLNKDVDVLREVFSNQGTYFNFGSHSNNFDPDANPNDSWVKYLDAVSATILARMRQNEAVQTKTYTRQRLNMDYLFWQQYDPLMQELKMICKENA